MSSEKPELPFIQPLRIVHILSGDRWAGAEVQAFTLLRQLQPQTTVYAIVLNEGELAQRCRSEGIRTTVLDENSLSTWRLFRGILSHLKEIRPHVVHTHRQKEHILGSVANLLSGRARCVRTAHGAPEFLPSARQRLQIWLDNLCGRHLQDAIIVVSADLKNKLGATFPQQKLHVIRNGIDPDEVRRGLSTPEFRRREPEARHVGLVGRLDPVKRVDLFLRMAALLLKEAPAGVWRFHVFGEGKQEGGMKQLAIDLGIGGEISFHGHRPDIRGCIAGLDAVVMPSDHEGIPMAALESLALGIPLLAHDTGGLSELLRRRRDCLVTDHSPAGYARGLKRLLADKSSPPGLEADYLASRNAESVLALYMPPREICAQPDQIRPDQT